MLDHELGVFFLRRKAITMRIIRSITLKKYKNPLIFKKISEHIYRHRRTGSYRMTLFCELEKGEDSQYPLEDILDNYFVNCTDYIEEKQDGILQTLSFELEGSLEDDEEDYANVLEVSKLIGRRVYTTEDEGSAKLIIEQAKS